MRIRAPDLIEPLLGWRAWNVGLTVDGWRLHSVHMRDPWPTGVSLDASCHRARWLAGANVSSHGFHDAPSRSCECGVYAAARVEEASQYFVASWAELANGVAAPALGDYVPRAIGEVRLWGRVLECAQGYRAEHAYPSRIWLPVRRPDGAAFDVEAVALDLLDYGVGVELLDVATRAEISERLPRRLAA